MGCILKYEFYLHPNQISTNKIVEEKEIFDYQECNLERYKCRVYRRVRWIDDKKKDRKYKDWKIKVIQEEEPKTWDIMFLHRLPCKNNFESVKNHLRDNRNFKVFMNEYCLPRPINYLRLTKHFPGKEIQVHSQSYYDINIDKQPQANRDFIKNSSISKFWFN